MDHFITARLTGDKLRADHLAALHLDPDVSRFLGEGRLALPPMFRRDISVPEPARPFPAWNSGPSLEFLPSSLSAEAVAAGHYR